MRLRSSRLAVVLLGERLVVASVQGTRVETFTVDAVQDLKVRVVNMSQPKELLATMTVSGFILPDKPKV